MKLILGPHDPYRLGDFLLDGFKSDALAFRGASAFARRSGVAHLASAIETFSADRPFRLTIGVDLQGTSIEALELLLKSAGKYAELTICHNPSGSTFHPKLFCFEYDNRTEVYVGSGNLTRGGLFTNYEAGVVVILSAANDDHRRAKAQIVGAFDRWTDVTRPTTVALTHELVARLTEQTLILPESKITTGRAAAGSNADRANDPSVFGPEHVPPPPISTAASSTHSLPGFGGGRNFVITLQTTDVGYGQTTPGTQARAAELFIPLVVVRARPNFWGWPDSFVADPKAGPKDKQGVGKMDRHMPFELNGAPLSVRMTYNPVKRDFRLGSSALREAGQVGDIMHVKHDDLDPTASYVVRMVSPNDPGFVELQKRCSTPVRNSPKRFGYF